MQSVRLFCLFFLAILLISGAPLFAEASGFSGTYRVTAVVDSSGKTYTTDVGIEDLGGGRIEVSASYEGIPFSFVGKSDSATADGGVYRFDVDIPKLFKGQAELTVSKTGDGYAFSGKGGGDYDFMGQSGSGSGVATGKKSGESILGVKTALPALEELAKPFGFLAGSDPFPTPGILTILGATGIALFGAFISRFAAGIGSSAVKSAGLGPGEKARISDGYDDGLADLEPPEEPRGEDKGIDGGSDEGGDE